ncbi:PEPxxWA-CTERM sorting domain-containing protein [uncultured Sphingomonas sp.]|uniref:PEPxxWA-CTERM sorting domain-containing protein n=1 Tax=uncultured Sphingomonas sp. TaxID=158754 RepID=UPI0025E79088|nr:PEPxxWA-CTERM sorting domain-containing protein [uncultured Sphingomonas sp.]
MQTFVKYLAMLLLSLIGLGTAGVANASPTILINDANGSLVSYDTATKVSTVLSTTCDTMYDIALNPGGDLYGVDGGTLYRISTASGATTMLGSLGSFVNGLVFGADGTLYGSGDSNLYKINTTTGVASLVGAMGKMQSAGDLAFFKGQLYLASDLGLAVVNTTTGVASLIGGTSNIFGLASTADALFGVMGTSIYNINPTTGVGVAVASYKGSSAYGAASIPTPTAIPTPTSVPEPATWAMLLLGLVLVGIVLRRRQTAPRAAFA